MERVLLPILLPVAVLLAVGVMMGGLGLLFTSVGRIGTIAIGLAIIVAVPAMGVLLTRGR
ncbi:MAG: hypothetical protein HYY00_06565 [Chloroflexi bacterium]|nr:hypothetical protein [Chloroflexota bacterium]